MRRRTLAPGTIVGQSRQATPLELSGKLAIGREHVLLDGPRDDIRRNHVRSTATRSIGCNHLGQATQFTFVCRSALIMFQRCFLIVRIGFPNCFYGFCRGIVGSRTEAEQDAGRCERRPSIQPHQIVFPIRLRPAGLNPNLFRHGWIWLRIQLHHRSMAVIGRGLCEE